MRTQKTLIIALLALLVATSQDTQAGFFGPEGKDVKEKQDAIRQQRDEMLAQLYESHPELKTRIKEAVGYATFNQKDMNLFLLASGNGYGVLVDKSGKETFMRMGSLGGGIGMGLKDVRAIFIFHDEKVMKQFIEQGWQFGGKGDVSAKYENTGVAAEQNVKANVDIHDGTVAAGSSTDIRSGTNKSDLSATGQATRGPMEIYQFTEKGLSLQATVSGTKYWKDAKLNP
jgi:lipid-binding SYLF domain-containing protein